jgi:hypothetical protein
MYENARVICIWKSAQSVYLHKKKKTNKVIK